MKSISSYNRKNKENIARLIASVYSNPEIPEYLRDAILIRLIWIATENDNEGAYRKYFGQPFWSEGALRQVKKNLARKVKAEQDLRHEHSVPKKEIYKRIVDSDKSYEKVFDILDKFAHSVVVSLEEDKMLDKAKLRSKLPEDLKDNCLVENIFSRYFKAEIRVYFIGAKDPKTISEEEISMLPLLTR